MDDCKQAIVVRDDLSMSNGKRIVQACHASVGAYQSADNTVIKKWKQSQSPKVALKAKNEESIKKIEMAAERRGITSYVVSDAGKTELDPGTVTCIGVGPAPSENVDAITGNLTLV